MTMHRPSALALVALLAAAGCAPQQPTQVLSSKPAVELRAMQSRVFDSSDRTATLRAVIATLQDLGYKIDKVEPPAGTVSATKLGQLRLTASVAPRNNDNRQMIVRANAIVRMPGLRDTQIDDPLFYQQHFFEPLSEAMFLSPIHVSDEPASPDNTSLSQ